MGVREFYHKPRRQKKLSENIYKVDLMIKILAKIIKKVG